MSIRIRLLLSYIAMLLAPVFLFGIAVMIISYALLGDVRAIYQPTGDQRNPIAAVLEQEANISAEIRMRGLNNPDSLLDPAVQQQLDEQLTAIRMGLVVRKGEQVVYKSPAIDEPELLEELPPYGAGGNMPHDRKKFGGPWRDKPDHWFITKQNDVVFKDGGQGSAFIAMDMSPLGQFAHQYFSLFLFTLLFILILTNGLLTYFVSRSIIRPLRALKKAADQIKEGNLDFVVRQESKDEIGELALSFEQMRSRLKQSVQRQLQYEENRKELISNISHDLKTPITAIKGYVEGIMDGVTNTPEKLDKYVRTIYNKSVQMDRLIDELFLFSKLDLNSQPFHFEQVNLVSFLQDCIDELHMDIEKQGVSFQFEEEPGLSAAWVDADRDKLKRVVINIIENAMKYMDKDKEQAFIRMRIKVTAQWYAIEIEDNGQGIDPEALPHIFDRFYRADRSRNTNTGGSGLGLAIAKQIMEGHDGGISAASVPGAGTVITIRLKKQDTHLQGGGGGTR